MKTRIIRNTFIIALMLCSGSSFSQCKEVVWPENPEMRAKAEESKVLYEDALRANQLKQAQISLNWLLANVPNFHSSLYINGAEVYDKLASQEKNPARKKVYVDSLMIIYDMRVKNCGDEANVINRKALSFLKHYANEQPVEALKMIDKALELNGNEIMDPTLVPYFQVVRLNVAKFKSLSEEQILERYDKLTAIIDAKIAKAQSESKPTDKYVKMKGDVDEILLTLVKVDCNFIKKNLEPKFKANPTDVALARRIFAFMLQGKCTDDPLWLETGEVVLNDSTGTKDCGLAKNLGIVYITKENYQKAEQLLKEAQSICADGKDKAEVLLYLGTIEARKGDKSGARNLYRQAASSDASVAKQAYEKIGDLYMNSSSDCAKKVSQAEDRLIYCLAYDYYQKAGDGKKMATAKEGFPSKTEIFEVNMDAGATKNVGCWINESTVVRTRD